MSYYCAAVLLLTSCVFSLFGVRRGSVGGGGAFTGTATRSSEHSCSSSSIKYQSSSSRASSTSIKYPRHPAVILAQVFVCVVVALRPLVYFFASFLAVASNFIFCPATQPIRCFYMSPTRYRGCQRGYHEWALCERSTTVLYCCRGRGKAGLTTQKSNQKCSIVVLVHNRPVYSSPIPR